MYPCETFTARGETRLSPLFLVCLLACNREKPSRPTAVAAVDGGAATALAAPAPSASPLPAPATSVAPQSAVDVAQGMIVDSPAWPTEARPELKLTWAVYPPKKGAVEQDPRNLELVARMGGVTRRLPLGPQIGALHAQNQSVCAESQLAYKKGPGEVAKITFYMGGAVTFAVKRTSPSLLEIVKTVASDGYCPEHNCAVVRRIASIPVPADARVKEAVTIIESVANEHPFACDGTPVIGKSGTSILP